MNDQEIGSEDWGNRVMPETIAGPARDFQVFRAIYYLGTKSRIERAAGTGCYRAVPTPGVGVMGSAVGVAVLVTDGDGVAVANVASPAVAVALGAGKEGVVAVALAATVGVSGTRRVGVAG